MKRSSGRRTRGRRSICSCAATAPVYGVECKLADAPRTTPSIRNALADLDLARVAILYPGSQRFPLSDRVEVVPLSSLGRGDPLFP